MHEFQIQLSGSPPQILMENTSTANPFDLYNIPLTALEPSPKRRKFITEVAGIVLENDATANSPEIRKMIMRPDTAESAILERWNDFVSQCHIPDSFQVPERAHLSLGDLVLMRKIGCGGSVDAFAGMFP